MINMGNDNTESYDALARGLTASERDYYRNRTEEQRANEILVGLLGEDFIGWRIDDVTFDPGKLDQGIEIYGARICSEVGWPTWDGYIIIFADGSRSWLHKVYQPVDVFEFVAHVSKFVTGS